MTAYLIIHAQVDTSIKKTFGILCQTEHPPKADKTFNAVFVKLNLTAFNSSYILLSIVGLFFSGSIVP
jgi:hypothetical protein|tara:strand:+ start:109 stop:312 length:204 start_codon:yes stop_codon:yes gene_type:complete